MENVTSNELYLAGEVLDDMTLHHTRQDDKFMSFNIGITRHSGVVDSINVLCLEKLLHNQEIKKGDHVKIFGQLRTYDKVEENRKKLLIFAYVLTIEKISKEEYDSIPNKNLIKLTGNICKEPVNRTTATKRIITDLLIATNRSYRRSDYIPCIAWGANAYYSKMLKTGDLVKLEGRLQSREKKGRTYYDLSINNIKQIDETEEVKVDESTNN